MSFRRYLHGLHIVGPAALLSANVVNAVGNWMLGLPVGDLLCFTLGSGVRGFWYGLATGLTFVAVTLILSWTRRVRRLAVQLGWDRASY